MEIISELSTECIKLLLNSYQLQNIFFLYRVASAICCTLCTVCSVYSCPVHSHKLIQQGCILRSPRQCTVSSPQHLNLAVGYPPLTQALQSSQQGRILLSLTQAVSSARHGCILFSLGLYTQLNILYPRLTQTVSSAQHGCILFSLRLYPLLNMDVSSSRLDCILCSTWLYPILT